MIQKTEEWVKNKFEKDGSGHDFWHIQRVVTLAEKIAEKEGANIFTCQMAAYLHDIPDEKLVDDVEKATEEVIRFLQALGLTEDEISPIWNALKDVSFKGNHTIPQTIEGKVVQDADRLDALGAIGIARTFAYGGNKERLMHDPTRPLLDETKGYRDKNTTSVQHFYEKLFKLKDLINTETAKNIAEERHAFMKQFLDAFFKEWKGDDY